MVCVEGSRVAQPSPATRICQYHTLAFHCHTLEFHSRCALAHRASAQGDMKSRTYTARLNHILQTCRAEDCRSLAALPPTCGGARGVSVCVGVKGGQKGPRRGREKNHSRSVPVENAGLSPGGSQDTTVSRSGSACEKSFPAQPWEEAATLRTLPQKSSPLNQARSTAHLTPTLDDLEPETPTRSYQYVILSSNSGAS